MDSGPGLSFEVSQLLFSGLVSGFLLCWKYWLYQFWPMSFWFKSPWFKSCSRTMSYVLWFDPRAITMARERKCPKWLDQCQVALHPRLRRRVKSIRPAFVDIGGMGHLPDENWGSVVIQHPFPFPLPTWNWNWLILNFQSLTTEIIIF